MRMITESSQFFQVLALSLTCRGREAMLKPHERDSPPEGLRLALGSAGPKKNPGRAARVGPGGGGASGLKLWTGALN